MQPQLFILQVIKIRALGSRSILANPMNKNMKDILNKKVKFREQFRPFAPSCLEKDAKNFFILNDQKSFPFMTFTVDVKSEKKLVFWFFLIIYMV